MVIAPHFHGKNGMFTLYTHISAQMRYTASLVEDMKRHPFSLLIDGSNGTGVEKLNPLTAKIYDNQKEQVTTHLLDMCTTTGRDCGTATAIFGKMNMKCCASCIYHGPIVWDLVLIILV